MTTSQPVDINPETWVDEHGDYLYNFALFRVQHSNIAEDLVQETFLSAIQSLKNFKGESTARTWLVGILKHKIIDHFRKNFRETPSSDIELQANLHKEFDAKGAWKVKPDAWNFNPHQLYENKEFWAVLKACMTQLSAKMAQAFILREIDGMESTEICKLLSISPTNSWVIFYRARMSLKGCLTKNWFTGRRQQP